MHVRVRILAKAHAKNARVSVLLKLWQKAHVRAMCVRPKIECANVPACQCILQYPNKILNTSIGNILKYHYQYGFSKNTGPVSVFFKDA